MTIPLNKTCSLVSLTRLASVTLFLTRLKTSSDPLKSPSVSFLTCSSHCLSGLSFIGSVSVDDCFLSSLALSLLLLSLILLSLTSLSLLLLSLTSLSLLSELSSSAVWPSSSFSYPYPSSIFIIVMHCTHLQRVSTAKSLFEEEWGTTTLNSARGHDCNSVSKHISLLVMKWVREVWQGNYG